MTSDSRLLAATFASSIFTNIDTPGVEITRLGIASKDECGYLVAYSQVTLSMQAYVTRMGPNTEIITTLGASGAYCQIWHQ